MPRRLRGPASILAMLALAAGAVPGVTAAATPNPIPAHVYSPYFEAWTSDSLATVAQQSGARFFTIAFLETTSKTSCTLAWNGAKADDVRSEEHRLNSSH